MKIIRPRQPLSQKAHECAAFRAACVKAGIRTPLNCGPAIRDLLVGLRSSPLLLLERGKDGYYHRATPTRQPLIGMAIKAGFARFVSDEKLYVITPAGETWLTELEIHGLIKSEEAAA
jgi:hypothetical protein